MNNRSRFVRLYLAILPSIFLLCVAPARAEVCSLDIDGNGQLHAVEDGALIVGVLFGLDGAALTGAVGDGATRTTAEQIADYVGGCREMLDVDRNGGMDALTDGLLVLRWLAGSGTNDLVDGAIGSGASRVLPADIDRYLSFYSTADPALLLLPPKLEVPLLSGLPATLYLDLLDNTGRGASFGLIDGPAGMTIGDGGRISWTPDLADEGLGYPVTVEATAGDVTVYTSFTVQVAEATPVATRIQGDTITVTEAGSSLNGLSLALPAQIQANFASAGVPSAPNLIHSSEVEISTISAEDIHPVPAPDAFTRLTDFFRVTPFSGADGGFTTLTFPALQLPAGREFGDLRLFVYMEPVDAPQGWYSYSHAIDLNDQDRVYVRIYQLGDPAFIGLVPTSTTQPPASVTSQPSAAETASRTLPNGDIISCQQTEYQDAEAMRIINGVEYYDLCQVEEAAFGVVRMITRIHRVTHHHWVETEGGGRWAGNALDITQWLWEAQQKSIELGLGLPGDLVSVWIDEESAQPAFYGGGPDSCVHGFVTRRDGFSSIYLRSEGSRPGCSPITADEMKVTTVHEFHHLAQVTPAKALQIKSPLFYSKDYDWITEGIATWFEDEVYDELDPYRMLESKIVGMSLDELAEKGIGRFVFDGEVRDRQRDYRHFAFWKNVFSHCSAHHITVSLYSTDQFMTDEGIGDVAGLLGHPNSRCSFGALIPANRNNSDAVLASYAHAVNVKQDLSLLDRQGQEPTNPKHKLKLIGWPPERLYTGQNFRSKSFAAKTWKLDVSTLPAGMESVLKFTVNGEDPFWIRLYSEEDFIGAADADDGGFFAGFRVDNSGEYEYVVADTSMLEPVYVTVVNSSIDGDEADIFVTNLVEPSEVP